MAGMIRIGTSGWVYTHWRRIFYPEGLPQSRWFDHYSHRFDTVEINGTFYREPTAKAVEGWRDQAPAKFLYAVKAHRFMTHMKKLVDCAEPVRRFFGRMDGLDSTLGPVLYQLAPNVPAEVDRLARFAALLPSRHAHVFEFRDNRWFTAETRDFLAGAGLGFCIHDARGVDCPEWATAKTVYYRFHGQARSPRGNYGEAALRRAAERIKAKAKAGHDVFVYFNNDAHGCAVANAQRLVKLVGKGK